MASLRRAPTADEYCGGCGGCGGGGGGLSWGLAGWQEGGAGAPLLAAALRQGWEPLLPQVSESVHID